MAVTITNPSGLISKLGDQLISESGATTTYQPSADSDSARYAAMAAALSASIVGDALIMPPGDIEVAAFVSFLNAGFQFLGYGTRLYPIAGGVGSHYVFTQGVLASSGADNQTIQGFVFDGNNDNTSFGGLFLDKSYNTQVRYNRFINWPQGNGAMVINGNPTNKQPGPKCIGNHFENNTVAIVCVGEYWQFLCNSFVDNGIDIDITPGGNTHISGFSSRGSTNCSIRVKAGSNNSHVTGDNIRIAHATGDSMGIEAMADNGVFLSDTYIASDDNSHGYMRINGGGLKMDASCYVNAPITADTTPTSVSVFDGVTMGTNTTITGLNTVAKRAMFRFQNCINEDGTPWAFNDGLSTVNTTDATPTVVATIAIPTNNTCLINVSVTARRTGGTAGSTGDSAAYQIIAAYKDIGGTVTEMGETPTFTAEDQGAWACVMSASSTNAIVTVTGAVDNNVTWKASYTIIKNP